MAEFIRRKCQSPGCVAMACPSETGYCSHHDLQRTTLGQRPGRVDSPNLHPWLRDAQPITAMLQ
jgi:hypothetical protein